MLRNNCAICEHSLFTDSFKMNTTINMVSDREYCENETFVLKFDGCCNCGCVQMRELEEPSKIYNQPLECFYGPALKKHYDLFNEFIIKSVDYREKSFFEIGGSYGRLAKLMIEKYKEKNHSIDYNILEFSAENYPEIENVKYISGNCENYDYTDIKTIIMSHVFEHLYEPRKFVNAIANNSVKNIFISIPDMDNLTINKDVNNLNIFHTYYLNTSYLTKIFNDYGYDLIDSYNYENNSVFYYFTKTHQIINNDYKNIALIDNLKQFYENLQNNISNINIKDKFFICPSGFYGKFIYYNLNERTKQNVIGFLDSDEKKIGKRLMGTHCKVFEKKEISNYEKVKILIVSEKHRNEIKYELSQYHSDISFILLI